MKRIAYSKDAIKTLRRLPANIAKLIVSKIEQFAVDPSSLANNVKALKGEKDTIRLRVGDWRVVMTDEGEVLAVVRIAPRGGAYD
jgi:mRNA interferase RelE/StbE